MALYVAFVMTRIVLVAKELKFIIYGKLGARFEVQVIVGLHPLKYIHRSRSISRQQTR